MQAEQKFPDVAPRFDPMTFRTSEDRVQHTRDFGMSRQMFYVLLKIFQQQGLQGLLPRKRGPKAAHKCTDAIIDFVSSRRQQDPDRSLRDLIEEVEGKFGVRLHPRTLQRRLWREEKKRPRTTARPSRSPRRQN
jgi:transposase